MLPFSGISTLFYLISSVFSPLLSAQSSENPKSDRPASVQTNLLNLLIQDEYLGNGTLHDRTTAPFVPETVRPKPKHNFIELLIREHKKNIGKQTGSIDYRKVVQQRPWPFHEFAKTVAQLMGRKAGLADLSAAELESLKKVYNQSLSINQQMLKKAFEKAPQPTVTYIIAELKHLIHEEVHDVS